MGCFHSGAINKIKAKTVEFGPTPVPPIEKPNTQRSADESVQSSVRTFCSFSSFVLQNENPTIFEWSFQKEIAKGAMSRVFMSQHTETGEKCAAKVYNKRRLYRQTLGGEEPPYLAVDREIDIMISISHRYVLPIVEVIEDECSNSLILLLPYAEKGTLQSYINNEKPSEEILSICFFEIAESLRYIHSLNIVHRDIKPDNILVFSDTMFKLSDFSVSSRLETPDQKLLDTRGSPAFLSPEECGGDAFDPKLADVWAYGVTLYSCMFNSLPFKLEMGQGKTVASTVFTVTQLLNSEELVVPEDKGFSPYLIELIKHILQKDPKKRPTFEEIIKCKWFDKAKEVDKVNIELEKLEYEEEEEEEDIEENKK
ncbi:CAMK family protein kinase [Histomonas meleagridis]|uniref:CAMK family protein kinase n=1 Tax=Histomonas meleagridis TaxID=135588 RepID=UPI00355AA563|nr:CAMK family protein kinase [Histomonas meleagridis]KAH0802641.1 CAMK family protein kinase [Histomonas meleagridis]